MKKLVRVWALLWSLLWVVCYEGDVWAKGWFSAVGVLEKLFLCMDWCWNFSGLLGGMGGNPETCFLIILGLNSLGALLIDDGVTLGMPG